MREPQKNLNRSQDSNATPPVADRRYEISLPPPAPVRRLGRCFWFGRRLSERGKRSSGQCSRHTNRDARRVDQIDAAGRAQQTVDLRGHVAGDAVERRAGAVVELHRAALADLRP